MPEGQHLLVVRVTGRNGVDLHTLSELDEYLEGRHYEQLFTGRSRGWWSIWWAAGKVEVNSGH